MFYNILNSLEGIAALWVVVLVALLVSALVQFAKKSGWSRQYGYSKWKKEKLREHIFKVLDRKKYEISEYKPFNDYQITVYSANSFSKVFYVLFGVFLLLIGILPGIIWFRLGRSRLIITLKQSKKDLVLLDSFMKGRKWPAVWTQFFILFIQKEAFVSSKDDFEDESSPLNSDG